jgi:hypothetical protein
MSLNNIFKKINKYFPQQSVFLPSQANIIKDLKKSEFYLKL